MFYVPQLSNTDCGLACLKMVLANVLHDKEYLSIPSDENHGPYSYSDLEKIADKYGVVLAGFKVTTKSEILNCKNYPIIARIRTEQGNSHAIIVTKIRRNKVYIVDPNYGKDVLKYDYFLKIWDSTGLFVSNVNKKDYPYQKYQPISKFKKFLCYLFQCSSGIFIALGVYFINPNGPYLWSLIFLGLGLAFEIILRLYLFKLMKDVDNYFENNYEEVNQNSYYDYFVRIQSFKKNYLSSKLKIIYSLFVTIFIIFITIFNNSLYLPLILAPIMCAGIDKIYLKPKENRTSQKIAQEEELLRNSDNVTNVKMKVKNISNLSYKFAHRILIKQYIGVAVFFLVAILVQILTKSFTLSNVIFGLCVELLLYQNVVPIFSLEDSLIESTIDKAKLSNIFYANSKNKQ